SLRRNKLRRKRRWLRSSLSRGMQPDSYSSAGLAGRIGCFGWILGVGRHVRSAVALRPTEARVGYEKRASVRETRVGPGGREKILRQGQDPFWSRRTSCVTVLNNSILQSISEDRFALRCLLFHFPIRLS